ncbi:hypothetical protein DDB_G0274379 [Dictyostelium discoideum AX4]|uniref:Uncharacterized protein n=1 Tax=Dictyostelium discoideum TaxID=44689 RepID=Q86HN5_DICDI|nr:hypothetical protein DDB_G0274379 [Dictyostelium discoideum AX4]EAL70082.1 hypothetical protein DDB_G0274379 [Dictyostelium discoideum AX4]|eukprot:XP_644111.1 hypothetical protein DDB_G0274379 [Dictyostelium discoideum AX4]
MILNNLKKTFPRSKTYYITSLSLLVGSIFLMDKFLSGSYYDYLQYHKNKKIEKNNAIEDLARDRIRKRKEEEEKLRKEQEQQQNKK